MRRVFALLLLTPLLANCSDAATPVAPADAVLARGESPSQSAASPAMMVFGNPQAGTDYFPGVHDQSFHGKDRIIPGTVVIDAGETVTFQVNPGHRVAIYDEGTRPEDIQPNPGYYLLYAPNRVFLQPSPVPQFSVRVMRPGKYLVICAVNSHFFGANMYGWLIVR